MLFDHHHRRSKLLVDGSHPYLSRATFQCDHGFTDKWQHKQGRNFGLKSGVPLFDLKSKGTNLGIELAPRRDAGASKGEELGRGTPSHPTIEVWGSVVTRDLPAGSDGAPAENSFSEI